MKNVNYLVTGGAGFIGSNIVETLLNENVKFVRILDNLKTGKMENIQFLLDKYDNLEFMYGDISILEDCRKAVKDIDVITNQAALGSVPRSVNDPLSSHIANVNGFLNILIAAKEEGIKRVVYASSSSVYGDHPVLPKVEENTGNVLSPYAATKAIDEIYAGVFTKCYGMECIGLRYFNIFGPRQDPNGAYAAVIPKFISLMKSGKQPTINGDGTFSRDFTYVENAVQANILALTTDNEKCFGEAFNIGAGGQFSLLKLIDVLKKELNVDIDPVFGSKRPGDIPHSNADISKAQKLLNYNPKISFEEGIHKLITINKEQTNDTICMNDIDFDNLLNRDSININTNDCIDILKDSKIIITGGAGSIGSEIVKQLLRLDIHNLYIIDNNECSLYHLRNSLNELFPNHNAKLFLHNINDENKMELLFKEIQPDYVFHAAAYKHVTVLETNIYEAININIIGTKTIADLSSKYNVKKFLFVSTDKAVNPTNVMGASKRISELYIQHINVNSNTDFVITRFGNVLGSSGSVIPRFIELINQNKNIPVTHKEITRYFMSIQEAALLVLKAITIGKSGQILLFDMGEPVKIIDLAQKMIDLFPEKKISIDIVGLGPGEKLYEELLCKSEEVMPSEEKKIMIFKNKTDGLNFIDKYNELIQHYHNLSYDELKIKFKIIVPEYDTKKNI
jgi:UDP-N-acetylglucosamine 4-epimerase